MLAALRCLYWPDFVLAIFLDSFSVPSFRRDVLTNTTKRTDSYAAGLNERSGATAMDH
jgi:hypothetical protein